MTATANGLSSPPLIGIVGGLGPLASAQFVRTMYEVADYEREQELPRVALLSDPTFPDRTESLLAGQDDELLSRLCEALTALYRMGSARVVICCVTIHSLLDRVPAPLRERVVSLLDVVFGELQARRRPHLLLCTTGTRRSQVFQRHPSWQACREWVVLPDEADQAIVHDAIYCLKRDQQPQSVLPVLNDLMDRYAVDACIAGCTEIHLVAPQYQLGGQATGYDCLDPLTILARTVGRGELP